MIEKIKMEELGNTLDREFTVGLPRSVSVHIGLKQLAEKINEIIEEVNYIYKKLNLEAERNQDLSAN